MQDSIEAPTFRHERLDVYQAARAWRRLAHGIVKRLPRGNADIADQLSRASRSILLNIGEGAYRDGGKDAARFFVFARASAGECAMCLDDLADTELIEEAVYRQGRELLHRIVCMLCGLRRRALAEARRR